MPKYKPGDLIEYNFFGYNWRMARVKESFEKKGLPAFRAKRWDPNDLSWMDGLSTDFNYGPEVGDIWGYDHQILRILARA